MVTNTVPVPVVTAPPTPPAAVAFAPNTERTPPAAVHAAVVANVVLPPVLPLFPPEAPPAPPAPTLPDNEAPTCAAVRINLAYPPDPPPPDANAPAAQPPDPPPPPTSSTITYFIPDVGVYVKAPVAVNA